MQTWCFECSTGKTHCKVCCPKRTNARKAYCFPRNLQRKNQLQWEIFFSWLVMFWKYSTSTGGFFKPYATESWSLAAVRCGFTFNETHFIEIKTSLWSLYGYESVHIIHIIVILSHDISECLEDQIFQKNLKDMTRAACRGLSTSTMKQGSLQGSTRANLMLLFCLALISQNNK